jgi:hypothetical protein
MPGDDDYDDDDLPLVGGDEDDDGYGLGDLANTALTEEVYQLKKSVALLLDAMEESGGREYTRRVAVDIPQALYLVAQTVTGWTEFKWTGDRMQKAMEGKGKEGRDARRAVRARMTNYLTAVLEEELKALASGEHPVMLADAVRHGTQKR